MLSIRFDYQIIITIKMNVMDESLYGKGSRNVFAFTYNVARIQIKGGVSYAQKTKNQTQ